MRRFPFYRASRWLGSALSLAVISMLATPLSPAGAASLSGDSVTGTPEMDERFTLDSDSHKTSASFVINGIIRDTGGRVLPNSRVTVSLDPSSSMLSAAEDYGSPAPGLPLAEAQSNIHGAFRLHVPALRDIDSYVDEGEVALLFTSFGDSHALLFRQYVALPRHVGDPALATVEDERILGVRAIESVRADFSLPALDDIVLTAATTPGNEPGTQWSPDEECGRVGAGLTYWWNRTSQSATHYTPVQRIHTTGRTVVEYDWENTNDTSVTTAIDFAYSGVRAKGGYTRSTNHSAGVNFSAGTNTRALFEASFRYYRYELACMDWNHQTVYPNVYEWRPHNFTGGNRNREGVAGWTCNRAYDFALDNPLWVSKKTTTTTSGGLSIIGVSLDARQRIGNKELKRWVPVTSGASVCGQDDDPVETEKVREGFYR